jgi:hypothetical protein
MGAASARALRAVTVLVALASAGLTSACNRPVPTDDLVAETLRSEESCRDFEFVAVRSASASRTFATTTATIECTKLVDDGTFGESCGNLLGCYYEVRVTRVCDATFQWTGAWAPMSATCREE